MKSVKELFIEFCRDEEGLTTVEYAVAGSLVAAGVVTAFSDLGDGVQKAINSLVEAIGGTVTTTSTPT